MMDKCAICDRPDAPVSYSFPDDYSKETQYCTCVKWQTLEEGIKLSLENAERLNSDAEMLLKKKRYTSSTALLLFSKEELGKAILVIEFWVARRNMPFDQYRIIFRSRQAHQEKLKAARRAFVKMNAHQVLGDMFAHWDRKRREDSLYVDYDFVTRSWKWRGGDIPEGLQQLGAEIDIDFKKVRELKDRMTYLFNLDEIKRVRIAVRYLRQLMMQSAKDVYSGETPTPPQTVVFAPAMKPKIEVSTQFTTNQLLRMLDKYESEMKELDQNSQRNKEWDYQVMNRNKLLKLLDEVQSATAKNAILLYQIGLLRVNLYNEYRSHAEKLESENKYDAAVDVMKEYANSVAIPFNKKRKLIPGPAKSILNAIARYRMTPAYDYSQQWRDGYKAWKKLVKNETDRRIIVRHYFALKSDFGMLYDASFSRKNFPELEKL